MDNITDGAETIKETGDALQKRTDAVNARFEGIADYIDSGGSNTTGEDISELGAEVGRTTNEAGDKIRNELPGAIKKVAGSIPGNTNSGTLPTSAADLVTTGATNIITSDIMEKDKTDEK